MNTQTKRRLIVVTGIIIIALAIILAVVGGNTSAKTIGIADAASGDFSGQRVQVTGNVVKNSYSTSGNVLTFSIYDPDVANSPQIVVNYDGAAASTFGNDVTAICTGKMAEDGTLTCSELVTKCPSKYESGTEALEVARMLEYGSDIDGTTVRVVGTVKPASQNAAGAGDRFVLLGNDGTAEVAVMFDGAASEETLADGAAVVLTGNMDGEKFRATDVSLNGDVA